MVNLNNLLNVIEEEIDSGFNSTGLLKSIFGTFFVLVLSG